MSFEPSRPLRINWPLKLVLAFPLLMTTACSRDAELIGVWEMRGYNTLIDVGLTDYDLYTVTEATCTPSQLRELEPSDDDDDDPMRRVSSDHYMIVDAESQKSLLRLDRLPETCSRQADGDPEQTFEAFWQFFDENYAFFAERGVDWQAVYRTYRPKISPATSSDELWNHLAAIVEAFPDSHVWLGRDVRDLKADRFDRLALGRSRHVLNPYFADQVRAGEFTDIKRAAGAYRRRAIEAIKRDILNGDSREAGNGAMFWSRLSPKVGYIGITASSGYASDRIFGADEEIDAETAGRLLDDVLDDFGDIDRLIIDNRFNRGGYGVTSLALASRFSSEARVAYSKQARDGDGVTPPYDVMLPADKNPFEKPVFLLNSDFVASGGESFALAMKSLPNVTLIGDNTQGILSDVNFGFLPNGWFVTSSNEIYSDLNGERYEQRGIPPDLRVPSFLPQDPFGQLGAPIDAALALPIRESGRPRAKVSAGDAANRF